MAKKAHFNNKFFKFLKDIKANNKRDWFNDNKDRYLDEVREPLQEFIADFGPHLKKISPHFVADPRPVGGSLFRIYRDTRFAKDKTPYKTHAAAQFRHRKGKDVHAPGFYLHLEPGAVWAGFGIWRPDSASLLKIRTVIAEKPAAWKKVINGVEFKSKCGVGGESLKRPPKGFDADHPLIEELKRKDFIASIAFTQKEATSPGFMEKFVSACKTASPYMKFLTKALDIEY